VVGMVVIVIVVVGSVRRTRNTISSIPSTSTDPSSLPSIRAYSEMADELTHALIQQDCSPPGSRA